MDDHMREDDGLDVRRRVLGAEYVDRALAKAGSFGRPMQELVTQYCWGTVWTRPGLALRDRSLINVAMLVALNREEELALHLRGALNNGCTREELQEVLLQAAVYCGVPAGVAAFRLAETIIEESAEDGRGTGDGGRS